MPKHGIMSANEPFNMPRLHVLIFRLLFHHVVRSKLNIFLSQISFSSLFGEYRYNSKRFVNTLNGYLEYSKFIHNQKQNLLFRFCYLFCVFLSLIILFVIIKPMKNKENLKYVAIEFV